MEDSWSDYYLHKSLSIIVASTFKFYATTFTATCLSVVLAGDPPEPSDSFKVVPIASKGFCQLLWLALRFQNSALGEHHRIPALFEQTIPWLGGLRVEALKSLTFDGIPTQRLMSHDITAEPGCILTFFIIILALVIIVIGQIWAFQIKARLQYFSSSFYSEHVSPHPPLHCRSDPTTRHSHSNQAQLGLPRTTDWSFHQRYCLLGAR